MFWRKSRFFKTLVFKLTFQFIVLYLILNIGLAFLIFNRIELFQDRKTDKQLSSNLKSTLNLVRNQENEYLTKILSNKSGADGIENTFYLVLDSTHTIIGESYIAIWGDLTQFSENLPTLPKVKTVNPLNNDLPDPWKEKDVRIIPTLFYKHYPEKNYLFVKEGSVQEPYIEVRVGYVWLPDGEILVGGISLKENLLFMQQIRSLIIVFLALSVVIGGALGFFLAKKSMKDVTRITKAVNDIQKGNLSLRVKGNSTSEEINNLTDSFNNMLHRIEELIREQKQLTDDIAHDLRSPVTGIRGLSEAGLKEQGDQTETFGQIISECDRLIYMVNSTLEISEIETGVFINQQSTFNLFNLLIKAVDIFTPVAEDKGIEIKTNFSIDNIELTGNINLIQRAISNIIDNAIKFTKTGGTIFIEYYILGDKVIISIRDSGIGIAKEEQERIFDKFYKVDKSRNTLGNGMGLSIARAYINLHNGNIKLDSETGKGTTFKIELPLLFPNINKV
ncbi:sensor histidine kinase [Saccharicrinis sp. FJH2]|uniref:sensor histidine kinase n=1 Tax=Saccharicrinis sp. FJH65 TaxID=3344659 RepID=UPI0035F24D87